MKIAFPILCILYLWTIRCIWALHILLHCMEFYILMFCSLHFFYCIVLHSSVEACRSKSDGNLWREKMREFQKSFAGKFYRKVLWESFSEKFYRKFYGKVLRESFSEKFYRKFYGEILWKSFTGKWGVRFGLRLGKVADPSQLQWGSQFY